MNVHKLLVLEKNTWNHTTVCKLLILDRNTWNHIIVCKQMIIDKFQKMRWNTENTGISTATGDII